ncbi:MAG: PAS domain S-box protein [Verrucomicrobia bacterium]|nr:PAS domain S-box protein [Verrucomicrobiota bacterium]
MALHTALTFLVVAAGLLFLPPYGGLMTLALSAENGGFMARRLLPVAVLLPLLLGWLRLKGQDAGWFGTEMGVVILVCVFIVVFGGLIWGTAIAINRTDGDRRRADDALRKSEMLFRQLFEALPDAILLVEADGRILQANSQVHKIFGFKPEELLGQPVEILIPEQHRTAHVQQRAAFSAAPERRPMGKEHVLLARRKDGVEFPAEIGLSPVASGGAALTLCVARDITERKQAELKVERLLHQNTLLLESIGEGI